MPAFQRKLSRGLRWFYRGQYLGTKYGSQAIYLSKSEALKAERFKLNELDEEARNPKIDIRLKELFTHRLDILQLTRNQEYYRDNRRLLKLALSEWGNVSASDISKKMVADLILKEIKRCRELKLGNARPNQLLKVLKATFNYANSQIGLEIKNPCNGLKKLPEDDTLKFIPREEMVFAVREKCADHQKILIDFVYETAARVGEAIALDYNEVKNDYVILYTRKSKNSSRVPRFVPRPAFIQPGGTGKVFKEWNAYPRFLEDIVKDLGQTRWNWHGLRHRRASIWANEGKPLFQIQMLLGHTQISTTQRYLHSLAVVML